MASEELKQEVKRLVGESKNYPKRNQAKEFVKTELRRLGAKNVDNLAEAILKRGFDTQKREDDEEKILEEVE